MNSSSNDSRNSSPNHTYISEEQSNHVNSSDEQDDEHESPVFNHYYPSDEQKWPRKRMKRSNVDRLTNLPDALITHILSLMPVQTAVKTQLLSKRWRYAWASSPVLSFPWMTNNKFITNALLLHKGPMKSLTLLGIEGPKPRVEPPTSLWVQCAVNKQIEVLVLEIYKYEKSYSLPHSFFSCDSLKEFSLTATEFDLGSSVFRKSLKKLSLENVRNLSNDKIQKIIKGSPELESFILSHCAGFSKIIVSASCKLRNLVIHYCGSQYNAERDNAEDEIDEMLEISGPSIRSLEISGYMGWQDCRLKDVSSLVQVKFRFFASKLDDCERIYHLNLSQARRASEMMHLLIRKISHVEKLSVGIWCTQVLSMCELGGDEPRIPLKCKTLEFFSLHERSIPGIARLLQSSHYLERLTIDTEAFQRHPRDREVENPTFLDDFNGENYWKSPERMAFKNSWQHLKVVKFIRLFDMMETKYMTELAEYLLGHAKGLEKLILKAGEGAYREYGRSDLRHSSLFQVMQKLLSYPRCSRHAMVLLL